MKSTRESHYSARNIEARILDGIRAAGLDPTRPLAPGDLAPLDHFHTGGLAASRELAAAAAITTGDRVVDVGAGLGGAARMLAVENGCRVECIEMSEDYCIGARLLNRLTGIGDSIGVHQGSALEMPFDDASFDLAWMQNVGMNIEDKAGLYSEIMRVLVPGGRFAFQEMVAGETSALTYPLPWASGPGENFLLSLNMMRSVLEGVGFVCQLFEDTSDVHLSRSAESASPAPPGQLGLSVFVDNLQEKSLNARRSLEEGHVRLVRGVFSTRRAGEF